MHPARIYRSAAAKLAAAFFGVFLLLFLIATVTTYLRLRDELIETVDDRLESEHEIISEMWDPAARDSFIENVRALAALSDPKISVLLLTASDGSRLAGNIDPLEVKSGLSMDPLAQVKRRDDYSYRLYSKPVGDMRLTIGSSLEDIEELLETSLVNLAWTSALAVFLAIARKTARADVQARLTREVSSNSSISSRELPMVSRISPTGLEYSR